MPAFTRKLGRFKQHFDLHCRKTATDPFRGEYSRETHWVQTAYGPAKGITVASDNKRIIYHLVLCLPKYFLVAPLYSNMPCYLLYSH